jgi:general stress protein YciG
MKENSMSNPNQYGQNMNPDEKKQGQNAPGNFKNDPDRAREAGRKGGEQSQGGRQGNERE